MGRSGRGPADGTRRRAAVGQPEVDRSHESDRSAPESNNDRAVRINAWLSAQVSCADVPLGVPPECHGRR